MDTDAANQICSMLRVQRGAVENASAIRREPDAEAVDADYSPEITGVFNHAALHGAAVSDALERALDLLQEAFLLELHEQLERAGFVLKERLEISLAENGELQLKSGMIDNDELRQAVAASFLLPSLFHRLHRLTLTLRGVEYIRAAGESAGGPVADDVPLYKICLKGPLSHFYLV